MSYSPNAREKAVWITAGELWDLKDRVIEAEARERRYKEAFERIANAKYESDCSECSWEHDIAEQALQDIPEEQA